MTERHRPSRHAWLPSWHLRRWTEPPTMPSSSIRCADQGRCSNTQETTASLLLVTISIRSRSLLPGSHVRTSTAIASSALRVISSKARNRHRWPISLGLIWIQLLRHSLISGFTRSSKHSYGNSPVRYTVGPGRSLTCFASPLAVPSLLRAPNRKRVWGAVVVDGVYGETFGQ
jgi:hypothetical protein